MATLQIRKEELDELATCVFCLGLCKHPAVLPCQHYFCEKPCLEQYLRANNLACPVCSRAFTADQAQPFRFFNQLLEKLKPVEPENFECAGCARNYRLQLCPITQRKVCRECAQRARREAEMQKAASSSSERATVCSKWPLCGDADCPDVHPTGFCQNIGCRGTEYCRKMHMDELKSYLAAGPCRQNSQKQQKKAEADVVASCSSAGPSSQNSASTVPTSSSAVKAARPAAPARTICTDITCPGGPTCDKIHLCDLPKFQSGTGLGNLSGIAVGH